MDFPFDIDEEEPEAAPASGTLASRVLLVDDEPVVLDVMIRLLSREPDLTVTAAASAAEARARLAEQSFDVLITDKNLPDANGIELISEATAEHPGMEAVMITGYASAESVIAALAAGASDYLLKPFDDLRTVRAKVRAALDRRSERSRGRRQAKLMAREAKELLERGRDVPEATWCALEDSLDLYAKAVSDGGLGLVRVVAEGPVALQLAHAGVQVEVRDACAADLGEAEVVVLSTGEASWRELADRLAGGSSDVLLLADPGAGLGELLDALSLKLELVGYGGAHPTLVLERINGLLMRRSVHRAQVRLAEALDLFRQALAAAGP